MGHYCTTTTHNHHTLAGWASRAGWAVASFSHVTGELLASAYGKPPAWVDGIHGAELRSLLQTADVAGIHNQLRTDCIAVMTGAKQGQTWANAASRRYGRVWGPVAVTLEDSVDYRLAWMPAHCSETAIGKKMLSNGFPLHAIDVTGNAYVARWAKAAAAEQSLPKSELKRIVEQGTMLTDIAKWVGICTAAANHFPAGCDSFGKAVFIRDSDAASSCSAKKRKRSPSPVVSSVPGDYSQCPRWVAIRDRIRSRVEAS